MKKSPSQKQFESFTKTGKICDYIKYLKIKKQIDTETANERLGDKDGVNERNCYKSN